MKTPLRILLIGLVSGAIGFGFYAQLPKPESIPPVATAGTGLPALILPDLNGTLQAITQWQGKILVANYWATWCPPCREEMPAFSRLQTKYSSNGVQFVGISIDSAYKVREFQKATPVNYPLLIGNMEAIESSVRLGNAAQALPFTAIFDRSGQLSSVKLGRLSESDLEQRLQALLH